MKIKHVMTKDPSCCLPSHPASRAAWKENQIRRVPVIDEQHRLQGIVSMADLVGRADVKPGQTHETLKKVSASSPEPSKPRARSRAA